MEFEDGIGALDGQPDGAILRLAEVDVQLAAHPDLGGEHAGVALAMPAHHVVAGRVLVLLDALGRAGVHLEAAHDDLQAEVQPRGEGNDVLGRDGEGGDLGAQGDHGAVQGGLVVLPLLQLHVLVIAPVEADLVHPDEVVALGHPVGLRAQVGEVSAQGHIAPLLFQVDAVHDLALGQPELVEVVALRVQLLAGQSQQVVDPPGGLVHRALDLGDLAHAGRDGEGFVGVQQAPARDDLGRGGTGDGGQQGGGQEGAAEVGHGAMSLGSRVHQAGRRPSRIDSASSPRSCRALNVEGPTASQLRACVRSCG